MTRTRKRALLITAILLALPVLFLFEEHLRGKRGLAKFKRELVAKGEKLTIEECRPPFPAEADNGYGEFLRAMTMVESQSIADAAPPSLRAVAPGKVHVTGSLVEWPKSNASRKAPVTNSNWRVLEDALEASREPLQAARFALQKPGFDGRWVYSLVHFQLPPDIATLKRAGQCFNAASLLHLHQARLEEALEDLEGGLRLSHGICQHRILIAQLVRYAVASSSVGTTWQALQTPGWNDALLARLQQAWQTNEFVLPGLHAIEMERAMAIDWIGQMRDSVATAANQWDLMNNWGSFGGAGGAGAGAGGVQTLDDLTQKLGEKSGDLLNRGIFIPLWQFAWSFEDERNYLASTQAVLDGGRATGIQYSIFPTSEASRELERRSGKENFYDRLRHVSSGAIQGILSHYIVRAATLQAQRDLAVTAIALKRYELRHTRLPPDLAALTPGFLPGIPRDIFDGQPLRYRPVGEGGFLLYSIGKDEKDDGGDPKPPAKSINASFFNGRDLVWPQPASVRETAEAEEKEKRKK